MDKHYLPILVFLFTSLFSLKTEAQQSFVSAGDEISGLDGNVSYSIGQVFYSEEISAPGNFNEGVQQSYNSLPTLSTNGISGITYTSAISGGNVWKDGGSAITERGIVFNLIGTPTILDSLISSGIDTGSFVSNLSFLNSNTTYYVRAFATNSEGTAYGNEEVFTTSELCDTINFGQITAVSKIGNPKTYRAIFTLPQASNYRLQIQTETDTTWRTNKTWTNSNLNQQNFQALEFAETNILRIGHFDGSQWQYGCTFSFESDCKSLTTNVIELVSPFCEGDSALLKVIANGGYRVKTFLWSTGEITRFIYGQQGQTYSVEVTDESGCTQSVNITVSTLNIQNTPSSFSIAKPNAVTFTGSWDAANLGSGVSLIGYRMVYRQAGVGASWTSTTLTTNTSATVNFTGSGLPAANYDFAVFARVNDNGSVYNSEYTCIDRKFYNGTGAKSDGSSFNGMGNARISIYPNPTSNNLYIQAESGALLQLFDMHGKLLNEQTSMGTEASMNMSAYAKGVYMVKVTSNDQVHSEQIMKD